MMSSYILEPLKKVGKLLWNILPDNPDGHAMTVKEALAKITGAPVVVDQESWHQQGARMQALPYRKTTPGVCVHKKHHNDCDSCHRDAHIRAMIVIYGVTEAMGHLKTSDVFLLAHKLAVKMEELEDGRDRKWGIALTAEANFDLATRDKAPLPTHFHVLPGVYTMTNEMTYIPELLEKVLGISRSEGRRLIKGGAIKIDGHKLVAENVSNVRLNGAIIVVGKQGKSIMCHYGIQNSTGYRATSEEDINAALQEPAGV